MIYGRAYKPFTYRALVPATVRMITYCTPEVVKQKARDAAREKRLIKLLGWEPEYLWEYFVALAIMFLCILGLLFALRYLVAVFL
jgi:hypothetical protein